MNKKYQHLIPQLAVMFDTKSSLRVGWYRTEHDYWYWCDGWRFWHSNSREDGSVLWVEAVLGASVYPSSILEALIVRGKRIRDPDYGIDTFKTKAEWEEEMKQVSEYHNYRKSYKLKEYIEHLEEYQRFTK